MTNLYIVPLGGVQIYYSKSNSIYYRLILYIYYIYIYIIYTHCSCCVISLQLLAGKKNCTPKRVYTTHT